VAGARTTLGLWAGGLGGQATNLKAAIYWTAVAALGVGAGYGATAAVVLIAGCGAISAAGHAAYALAFSHPGTVNAYDRVRPVVQSGLCAFFCVASVTVLTARP
jgi:threonine/homoserine/homoserine lactone efflux protein